MIKSRCETVSKYILPAVRGLIARSLVEEYGFTQSYAAKVLGITQAAISYYVSSKRGRKMSKKLENNKEVMSVIKYIAERIADAKDSGKIDLNLCDVCKALESRNKFRNQ
jgi:hypothetical protein